jgi:hypothetical protein
VEVELCHGTLVSPILPFGPRFSLSTHLARLCFRSGREMSGRGSNYMGHWISKAAPSWLDVLKSCWTSRFVFLRLLVICSITSD